MVAGSVGVVIGTFGADEWADKGAHLARILRDVGTPCVHVHGATLAEARNTGALWIQSDTVVFLDADDDLGGGYCDAMAAAATPNTILQPSTRGRVDGILDDFPLLIPRADLSRRNYLVIGSAVNRLDFLAISGFRDLPVLEDWDLWCRLVIKGASVKRVPDAIYIVNVHPNSRNTQTELHGQIYRQLQQEYAPYATILRDHVVV
jgi:glycosyltransferase involved in cell wall biosynthesis